MRKNHLVVEEIWVDVEGFEGIYKISNAGRVLSVAKNRIRKTKRNNRGYHQICLHKNGKQHYYLLHRLVAMHFVPNPHNYPQVNHIDEDKDNNNAINLEWCTNLYNAHYGTRIERTATNEGYQESRRRMQRQVIGIHLSTGDEIKLNRIVDGAELGFDPASITNCCKGRYKSHKGYKWQYAT